MIMSFFKDKLQWIFAVVSLLVITTGCVSQNSSRAQLSVAADSNGFKISNQLFDISVFSKVIACEPPWRANRFYTMIDPIRCEINSDGGRIIQDGKFDEINFKDYSVKFNGNSGVMTLDMELLKELPTFMEYTIFVLPENLLAGAEFTAETADGKIVSGSVPVSFGSSTEIVYLVKDAVKFSASNNYGTFQFDVVEGKPFTVADRRGVPFENMRCYWIGNDGDMVKGVPVKSVVNFSYTINPELKIAAPEYGDGKMNAVQKKEVFSSRRIGRPLLPAPKEIRYADGVLTGNFAGPEFAGSNALSEQDAAKLERAAERLGLTGNGGAKMQITVGGSPENGLAAPQHPEGYAMKINEDGLTIAANSARGAFYALQTVAALADSCSDGGSLPFCEVRDWPDMDIRGIHAAHMDADALEHYSFMIENVLAPMKMNHILLECEYVAWDTTKGLHIPNAMSKEQLKQLLQTADENFIEVTPLFQTLSHVPWLFEGGKNLDMAEDPNYPLYFNNSCHSLPFAFNTSHPNLYPMLERLFDEVVEVFGQTRFFHVGLDELFLFGQFPYRKETARKGVQNVVYDHIMWCYNYARKHNMQLMLWQDIFVTKEESPENGSGGAPHFTAELRKKLPKDIIFTVWRYSGDFETFDDMKALAQDGFPVIGASWYATNNVENFTRFAREQNAMGMLSTTWIYTPNKDNYYYWFHQMAPYVRSGCWSWNVSNKANENLDAAKVFCDLHENAKPEEKHDGFTLDINGIANLSITGANNPFLSGITYGLDELGCGEKRCGNVLFDVAGKNGYTAAAAVKSSINPGFPEEIALENLNLKAGKLFFLHSSIGSIPPLYSNIASYTIYYKDGSTVEYPVKYGMEVGVPGADYNYYLSTGNAVELPFDGEISKVWYSVWNNPQPGKIISRIVLKSSGQPYYLFGISGF